MLMRSTDAGLAGRIRRVEHLTHGERDQMYSLMAAHYANMSRSRFEEDLVEKSWVCTITDPGLDQVCGFSTLMRIEAQVGDETVSALFSGDTIVKREYWGQQVLHSVLGRHMLTLAAEEPEIRTFWLLLSSGYKTYRLLPAFFLEFFPSFNALIPPDIGRIVHTLAGMRFGSQYHPREGVVRFDQPTPLRPGVAEVDDRRLRDPHVAFFVRANPDHAAGDELVCIAELAQSNLTPTGRDMIEKAGPHGQSRIVEDDQ